MVQSFFNTFRPDWNGNACSSVASVSITLMELLAVIRVDRDEEEDPTPLELRGERLVKFRLATKCALRDREPPIENPITSLLPLHTYSEMKPRSN